MNKYKLIQKVNPPEPGTRGKWYASAEDSGDFAADNNNKNTRVVFTPSPEFKKVLEKIDFKEEEPYYQN